MLVFAQLSAVCALAEMEGEWETVQHFYLLGEIDGLSRHGVSVLASIAQRRYCHKLATRPGLLIKDTKDRIEY